MTSYIQTCKRLQELCSDRAIWLGRLGHCEIQHTPDLPPHRPIESISNFELKRKIISAIQKDVRWRSPGRMHSPRVVTMQFGEPSVDRDALVEPKLLPGARELLSIRAGRLELWSVERQELLWTAPLAQRGYVCLAFEFELLEDGVLRVALVDAEEGFSQTCMLQILSVDMSQRTHEQLFMCDMPWAFFFRMMLRGDILLVPMPGMGLETLLINWRTGGRIILDNVDSSVSSTSLLRFHHLTSLDRTQCWTSAALCLLTIVL